VHSSLSHHDRGEISPQSASVQGREKLVGSRARRWP
jgi:hypothetical protein